VNRPRRDDEAPDGGARGPRPATLTAADDALLLDLARRITRRGLATPAVLWLESVRPLSFIGSQIMHFLEPFVRLLVSADTFGRLATILEERAHLERLLLHLEAVATEPRDAGKEAT
jgi:hypothetical protein